MEPKEISMEYAIYTHVVKTTNKYYKSLIRNINKVCSLSRFKLPAEQCTKLYSIYTEHSKVIYSYYLLNQLCTDDYKAKTKALKQQLDNFIHTLKENYTH